MPARGRDVPMRTIGASLFVCVSNDFARTAILQAEMDLIALNGRTNPA